MFQATGNCSLVLTIFIGDIAEPVAVGIVVGHLPAPGTAWEGYGEFSYTMKQHLSVYTKILGIECVNIFCIFIGISMVSHHLAI